MKKKDIKGLKGEEFVTSILRRIPNSFLLTNYGAKEGKYTFQIDHILISPKGIFVIETKNYKGSIIGNAKEKYWKAISNLKNEHLFLNPLVQNYGHISHLKNIIGKDNVFIPIIVFSYNTDKITIVSSSTPIIFVDQIESTINGFKDIYSLDHAEEIYYRLMAFQMDHPITMEEHIERTKKYRKKK